MKYSKRKKRFVNNRVYGFKLIRKSIFTTVFYEDGKRSVDDFYLTDTTDRWFLNRIKETNSKVDLFFLCKEYKEIKPEDFTFVWWGCPEFLKK